MFSPPADQASANLERNSSLAIMGPVATFITQTRHESSDPVVARFRATLNNLQASELERLYDRLPHLDEQTRAAIQEFADCLVETMLRPPLESLRGDATNGHGLSRALARLFQLEY
jgi:glutamyl-tRNA reductase